MSTWLQWRSAFGGAKDNGTDEDCPGIPTALRGPLAKALACLALGETGEGRIAAELRGWDHPGLDAHYHAAFADFLAEEGSHAARLRAWVRRLGGSIPESRWSAALFKRARRIAGVRTKMAVLLSAEVVAAAAYQSLANALPPGALRRDMERIARDETVHLSFHLAFFRAVLRRRQRRLLAALWRPLCIGSAAAAWIELGPVLRAVGVSTADYVACIRHSAGRVHREIMDAPHSSPAHGSAHARAVPASMPSGVGGGDGAIADVGARTW